VVPADSDLIFRVPPDKRWEEAIRRLGFDPSMLSGTSGTA
jgi:putative transcriptional regulator